MNYLSKEDRNDQLAVDNREIKSKLDDIQINNIAMANRIVILEGQLKGKNPAKTHEKDKHERQERNKPIKVVGDLLMIFDSNGKFLKPELTNTKIKCQHIHASKIDLACSTLQSCEFTVNPQKTLINA